MLSRAAVCINNRVLSKTHVISQKFTNRSIHVTCRSVTSKLRLNLSRKSTPAICSSFVRGINTDGAEIKSVTGESVNKVTENVTPATGPLEAIPDVPVPPPVTVEEIVSATNALGEPTLQSLGLGGWSPIGIIQQLLDMVHVSCGLPWWATIALGTVCVRTLLFPLVVISQRSTANLHNTLPGLQKIQNKITEARAVGDQLQAARYSQELMFYMKENQCNPLKSMIVPLCQAPIFISFFFGLKRMTNLPVDSMRQGGLWWFTDLTVTDPYFILPIMTSATLAITLKLGIDGPKLETMGMMKYVIQAIPIIILPFTINFPSAIVWYWVSTNIYSLMQVSILKIPKIRELCKIPKQIQHPPSQLQPKKAFKEGFKESWSNMKTAREMADRQHLDTIQFNKFGRGPLPKTYAYNPVEDSKKRAVAADKR
ncbi:mitochondrial inner membrane protein OXA1L [Microplitis demolitor]|uniref:mitochondrial inner membrane protein OXA1L n=1 Tax=Microplitis demolitor TaxID=69319 RepID=UPI0004CCB529|nr:mitochondrial inner membrane protein OXA1L [Microplitis demolitor]